MPSPVTIPLLNPNEPEAVLAALHVLEGQAVQAGQPLCTLETTKSAAELEAETGGYVAGLQASAGDTVLAGQVLCYLAETPDWRPPAAEGPPAESSTPESAPAGLRLTRPAQALAQALGLDLPALVASGALSPGALVTEQTLQALAGSPLPVAFDPIAIIVYGGGGHGKSLIDLLHILNSYRLAGVVDDALPAGSQVMGLPVLGGGERLPELRRQGIALAVNAVGGIGSVGVRVRIFERLAQAGFTCPAVVHPRAVLEPGASLAAGVQVFPLAYVGSEVQVGFGSIVNTGAIVSHDCRIGAYANISPGAILAGAVQIGDRALVGMGATVNLGVEVGAGARIGNGATVKQDLPENGLVRAGAVWPE